MSCCLTAPVARDDKQASTPFKPRTWDAKTNEHMKLLGKVGAEAMPQVLMNSYTACSANGKAAVCTRSQCLTYRRIGPTLQFNVLVDLAAKACSREVTRASSIPRFLKAWSLRGHTLAIAAKLAQFFCGWAQIGFGVPSVQTTTSKTHSTQPSTHAQARATATLYSTGYKYTWLKELLRSLLLQANRFTAQALANCNCT